MQRSSGPHARVASPTPASLLHILVVQQAAGVVAVLQCIQTGVLECIQTLSADGGGWQHRKAASYPSLLQPAQCSADDIIHSHGILNSYRGYCGRSAWSQVPSRASASASPSRRPKSASALSIPFPQVYPRPSCCLPRRAALPHVPRPGFSPRRHSTHARLHAEALSAGHRPGSRRLRLAQPTPSLLARPSISPAV